MAPQTKEGTSERLLRIAAGAHLGTANRTWLLPGLLALAWLSSASCDRPPKSEELARAYCASCHAFPEPRLLDKKTWELGVLPQMAPRLGVRGKSLADEMSRSPYMTVLPKDVSSDDWGKIVEYFRDHAPDSLPYQSWPAQAATDPAFFKTVPFVRGMQSSGIITLLKTDSIHQRIFIGEAGSNTLRIFDWNRQLLSTLRLGSPPTDLIVQGNRVLVLESGILDPNDEPKGSLLEYDFSSHDSLQFRRSLIDSLFRPVFVRQLGFGGKGEEVFVICEYGNNRGRLALYRPEGSRYRREILDPSPGAIRFEIRDMTGDGSPDIVALLAQADERIVLFENDGKGRFSRQRILARFPPVYGSMNFSMHDFNGDGTLDILYVNGDNYDYSRILKPYHGVRILENGGRNNFHERYFFPVYGAARAEVADFDGDGDPDLFVTSNFADFGKHPERGIVFLENIGRYRFRPYAFTIAAANQWNLMALADLDGDSRTDVLVGAMNLQNIGYLQRRSATQVSAKNPIVVFENRMASKSTTVNR